MDDISKSLLECPPEQIFTYFNQYKDTDKDYKYLFNSEYFWEKKFCRDVFKDKICSKPNGYTWKLCYKRYFQGEIKHVPIYFMGKNVDFLWFNKNETVRQIMDKINILLMKILFSNLENKPEKILLETKKINDLDKKRNRQDQLINYVDTSIVPPFKYLFCDHNDQHLNIIINKNYNSAIPVDFFIDWPLLSYIKIVSI